MWGQWIGTFGSHTNPQMQHGGALLNIDKDRQERGKLALYQIAQPTQSGWADLILRNDNGTQKGTFIIPATNDRPQPIVGEMLFVQITDTIISGTWTTNTESGDFDLSLYTDNTPPPPDRNFRSWGSFKKWIANQESGSMIYRGQSNNHWRLATLFHRTNRFDLIRYGINEVVQLNHYLTGLLDRSFNISDALEHGALLNLAQHHSFPTPLLDWTESPYIAAYFAFSELPKEVNKGRVRIFMFDKASWLQDHVATTDMNLAAPYFSIHQLLPLYNARALPQQSVVTSTNVFDIEGWLPTRQPPFRKYLIKVDLPASDRNVVMADLTSMGITAASLFPGVEGTCRALKERFF